jgi:hypothetical protein
MVDLEKPNGATPHGGRRWGELLDLLLDGEVAGLDLTTVFALVAAGNNRQTIEEEIYKAKPNRPGPWPALDNLKIFGSMLSSANVVPLVEQIVDFSRLQGGPLGDLLRNHERISQVETAFLRVPVDPTKIPNSPWMVHPRTRTHQFLLYAEQSPLGQLAQFLRSGIEREYGSPAMLIATSFNVSGWGSAVSMSDAARNCMAMDHLRQQYGGRCRFYSFGYGYTRQEGSSMWIGEVMPDHVVTRRHGAGEVTNKRRFAEWGISVIDDPQAKGEPA